MTLPSENHSADSLRILREVLRRAEPRLFDPNDFAEKVMKEIEQSPGRATPIRQIHQPWRPYLIHAQQFLTAASVCLLIWYGVEEYHVISKVNNLEKRMASVGMNPASTITARLSQRRIQPQSLWQEIRTRRTLLASEKRPSPEHLKSIHNQSNQ